MAKSGIKSYFPSQAVSDAEKLSYEYGLKIAKAIETEWFNDDRNSNRYRNNYNNFHYIHKFSIFILGFVIMVISQISFKFVSESKNLDLTIISFPIMMIFFYYIFLFSKTKFNFKTR